MYYDELWKIEFESDGKPYVGDLPTVHGLVLAQFRFEELSTRFEMTHEDIKWLFLKIRKFPFTTYLIETSDPELLLKFIQKLMIDDRIKFIPNIWYGMRVSTQKDCDKLSVLSEIPATVRYANFIQLKEKVSHDLNKINWVIDSPGKINSTTGNDYFQDIYLKCQEKNIPLFLNHPIAKDDRWTNRVPVV